MIGELTNHLWQSTLFVVVVGLLTAMLRKNRGRVRYGLWFVASFKFVLPFSLLLGLGIQLEWAPGAGKVTEKVTEIAAQITTPAVSITLKQIARPIPNIPPSASSVPGTVQGTAPGWVPAVILGVWAFGFGAIALMRLRGWRRIRAALRSSTPLTIPNVEAGTFVQIRSCPGLMEPGVVGFLRPILLLPSGIVNRLTKGQLEAVIAHERCRVRRRDNLTAAMHMIVEAVFWFHPLVWWIGARLVTERERACDEEVLRLGHEPKVYAEGILNVCKLYGESPLACVSGVTGSDLKKRVEDIMRNRLARKLSFGRTVLLAIAAITVLAGPVAIGLVNATVARAEFKATIRATSVPIGVLPEPRVATEISLAQAPPRAGEE